MTAPAITPITAVLPIPPLEVDLEPERLELVSESGLDSGSESDVFDVLRDDELSVPVGESVRFAVAGRI